MGYMMRRNSAVRSFQHGHFPFKKGGSLDRKSAQVGKISAVTCGIALI